LLFSSKLISHSISKMLKCKVYKTIILSVSTVHSIPYCKREMLEPSVWEHGAWDDAWTKKMKRGMDDTL
jgi:hypothetical protein